MNYTGYCYLLLFTATTSYWLLSPSTGYYHLLLSVYSFLPLAIVTSYWLLPPPLHFGISLPITITVLL